MKVIGINGKARHGKDSTATIIKEMAEARGLKVIIWSLAHALKARVYGEAKGDLSFEDVWVNKPPVLRTLLQRTGTELGRNVFGTDFWLLQCEAFIKLFAEQGIDLVIVPDIRFPNEVEFAQFNGLAPDTLRARLQRRATLIHGLSDEREQALLIENPTALFEIEADIAQTYQLALDLATNQGICIRIKSDRPTLEGLAAQHPSETACDSLPDEAFSYVITNNLDNTFDDLREQVRPILQFWGTP